MPQFKRSAHPIYREGEDCARSLEQNIAQFEAMLIEQARRRWNQLGDRMQSLVTTHGAPFSDAPLALPLDVLAHTLGWLRAQEGHTMSRVSRRLCGTHLLNYS
jgi:hypothetical protein